MSDKDEAKAPSGKKDDSPEQNKHGVGTTQTTLKKPTRRGQRDR